MGCASASRTLGEDGEGLPARRGRPPPISFAPRPASRLAPSPQCWPEAQRREEKRRSEERPFLPGWERRLPQARAFFLRITSAAPPRPTPNSTIEDGSGIARKVSWVPLPYFVK